ncbi:MAG: hypothetical protein EXS36_16930 [Pedosphaera sp.]|nr:hypothetical protein [Pedosphaera sp.]
MTPADENCQEHHGSFSADPAGSDARAALTAADLCGFSKVACACKNARELAQSKIWRHLLTALCIVVELSVQVATLHAQPAATNHVLELDGKDSYVELPPNVFNGLTEATVEAWVKWKSIGT